MAKPPWKMALNLGGSGAGGYEQAGHSSGVSGQRWKKMGSWSEPPYGRAWPRANLRQTQVLPPPAALGRTGRSPGTSDLLKPWEGSTGRQTSSWSRKRFERVSQRSLGPALTQAA